MTGAAAVATRLVGGFVDGVGGIVESTVDLLFPPQCAWCHVPAGIDQRLCQACRGRLVSEYYRCQKCAAPLPRVLPNADCVRCRTGKWRFTSVITLAPYRGDMRRAVIMMKRKHHEPLRRAIADLLGEKLWATFPSALSIDRPTLPLKGTSGILNDGTGTHLPPLLVPVPYHWSHGFSSAADTAELLAFGIAERTRWPVVRGAVRRVRKTAKQGVMSWNERKANVRKAFVVNATELLLERQVLLVDDVLTSGATAAELSRILLAAGAASVSVVVAARATGVRESPAME